MHYKLSTDSFVLFRTEFTIAHAMHYVPQVLTIETHSNWGAAVDNDLLARVEREGQAGAKMVFWAEANAPVFREDEAAFISRGAELASKYRMYLGMALGVWNTGKNSPFENKVVLIEPDGRVYSGAEAVFRALRYGALGSLPSSFYYHMPGARPVTEWCYAFVARHR